MQNFLRPCCDTAICAPDPSHPFFPSTPAFPPNSPQDNTTVQNGGNRHTTVLVYLSDVEEGGETVFPLLPPAAGQEGDSSLSECAAKHLAVKPRKGTGGMDAHRASAVTALCSVSRHAYGYGCAAGCSRTQQCFQSFAKTADERLPAAVLLRSCSFQFRQRALDRCRCSTHMLVLCRSLCLVGRWCVWSPCLPAPCLPSAVLQHCCGAT